MVDDQSRMTCFCLPQFRGKHRSRKEGTTHSASDPRARGFQASRQNSAACCSSVVRQDRRRPRGVRHIVRRPASKRREAHLDPLSNPAGLAFKGLPLGELAASIIGSAVCQAWVERFGGVSHQSAALLGPAGTRYRGDPPDMPDRWVDPAHDSRD
ncbi:hypothetical protein VUR80DRAFT_8588 [Thermomyces stellatus]